MQHRGRKRVAAVWNLFWFFSLLSLGFARHSGNAAPTPAEFSQGGAEPIPAEVQVDPQTVLHAIDPGIYGQFVEHFGRIIEHGLWAELLENRKFYPYSDLEHLNVAPPWAGDPGPKDVSYAVDRAISMDGISSQRLVLTGPRNVWRGIRQTGFDVLGDREYVGYAWIKTGAANQQAAFVLESSQGETAARAEAALRSGDWEQYKFTLKPARDLYPAVFRIAFNQPGVVWIGAASLMPGDNVDGIRKDVLDLVKQMSPPLLRWPGGGYPDSYDWRKAVGPRDRRPPQEIVPYGNPDGYDSRFDPNDFGTDEFLNFCRLIGARPYITVNFGSGSPEMAREWIEYCNGGPATDWGARRAANGHPQPYNVKDWAVGNENWLPVEPGYSTAEGYATYFNQFAEAMHKADPDARITAVGFALGDNPDWDKTVARISGRHASMLSIHYYYGLGFLSPYYAEHPVEYYKSVMAAPFHVEELLRKELAQIDAAAPEGRKLQVALDEWGESNFGKRPPGEPEAFSLVRFVSGMTRMGLEINQPLEDALYAARMLHVFMRAGDRVPVACRTHLVNSMGAIRTSSTDAFLTAPGAAMQLYTRHSGTKLVKVEAQSPTYDVPQNGWKKIPSLDATATVSEDGRTLFVHLINADEARPMRVRIRIGGPSVEASGDLYQLAADDFLARNRFGVPLVQVQGRTVTGAGGDFAQLLPPHSATTLKLKLK